MHETSQQAMCFRDYKGVDSYTKLTEMTHTQETRHRRQAESREKQRTLLSHLETYI